MERSPRHETLTGSQRTLTWTFRGLSGHIVSKVRGQDARIFDPKYRRNGDKNGRSSAGPGRLLFPVCTLRPLVRGQNPLSQADAFGSDFHQFVVVDELDGLLE